MNKFLTLTLIGLGLLSFQNCSQFGTIDPAIKLETLTKVQVFEETVEITSADLEKLLSSDAPVTPQFQAQYFEVISVDIVHTDIAESDNQEEDLAAEDPATEPPPIIPDPSLVGEILNLTTDPMDTVAKEFKALDIFTKNHPLAKDGKLLFPSEDPNANTITDMYQEITGNDPKKPSYEIKAIPVERLCSDHKIISSKSVNGERTLKHSPAAFANRLEFFLTDSKNKILCHIKNTELIRNQLIYQGSIDLAACPNPISAVDKNERFNLYLYADKNYKANLFKEGRNSAFSFRPYDLTREKRFEVLFNENPKLSTIDLSKDLDSRYYGVCDDWRSPLFVDLRTKDELKKGFKLSNHADGIMFDIAGKNAMPEAHTKKKIGWFRDKRMAFIALPNKKNRVEGINQLFGDNTEGPHKNFAKDGFHALAKYDGLKLDMSGSDYKSIDGIIDAKDEIFKKLVLWNDANSDGIGTSDEFTSLRKAGVEAIDLNSDKSFLEQDPYKNSVRYKSVVKMTNGDYKLMFDVWFYARGSAK